MDNNTASFLRPEPPGRRIESDRGSPPLRQKLLIRKHSVRDLVRNFNGEAPLNDAPVMTAPKREERQKPINTTSSSQPQPCPLPRTRPRPATGSPPGKATKPLGHPAPTNGLFSNDERKKRQEWLLNREQWIEEHAALGKRKFKAIEKIGAPPEFALDVNNIGSNGEVSATHRKDGQSKCAECVFGEEQCRKHGSGADAAAQAADSTASRSSSDVQLLLDHLESFCLGCFVDGTSCAQHGDAATPPMYTSSNHIPPGDTGYVNGQGAVVPSGERATRRLFRYDESSGDGSSVYSVRSLEDELGDVAARDKEGFSEARGMDDGGGINGGSNGDAMDSYGTNGDSYGTNGDSINSYGTTDDSINSYGTTDDNTNSGDTNANGTTSDTITDHATNSDTITDHATNKQNHEPTTTSTPSGPSHLDHVPNDAGVAGPRLEREGRRVVEQFWQLERRVVGAREPRTHLEFVSPASTSWPPSPAPGQGSRSLCPPPVLYG